MGDVDLRGLVAPAEHRLAVARERGALGVTGPRAGPDGGRPRLYRRPRRPLASEPLTSQETRAVLLVARGLPNREIAAALFLSPRTVEHHLASVFRKRGFRSRTEVAAAFATADPAQE